MFKIKSTEQQLRPKSYRSLLQCLEYGTASLVQMMKVRRKCQAQSIHFLDAFTVEESAILSSRLEKLLEKFQDS